MSLPHGTVRVRQHDPVLDFHVTGRGTRTQGLPLRRYAEQALAHGATCVRVDLRRCDYLDSTFLGTLLGLQRAVARCGQGTFALVSPSDPCRLLLHQMHLDLVYPITDAPEPDVSQWAELPCPTEDVDVARRDIVQAHQELAALAGPAGEQFRPVARDMERAMDDAQKGR